MRSKLTLSIDSHVIAEAKEYAKKTERSLSSLVEQFLKSLNNQPKQEHAINEDDPMWKAMREQRGRVKLPEDFTSYDEMLHEALMKKYMR